MYQVVGFTKEQLICNPSLFCYRLDGRTMARKKIMDKVSGAHAGVYEVRASRRKE